MRARKTTLDKVPMNTRVNCDFTVNWIVLGAAARCPVVALRTEETHQGSPQGEPS